MVVYVYVGVYIRKRKGSDFIGILLLLDKGEVIYMRILYNY